MGRYIAPSERNAPKCLAARLVVLRVGAYVANSLLDVVGQLELALLDKVLALLLRLDRVQLRLGLDFCPLSREVGRVHVSVRQKDRNAVFRLPTHGLEFLHKGAEAVPLCLVVPSPQIPLLLIRILIPCGIPT